MSTDVAAGLPGCDAPVIAAAGVVPAVIASASMNIFGVGIFMAPLLQHMAEFSK
jgi:hypothetical protein